MIGNKTMVVVMVLSLCLSFPQFSSATIPGQIQNSSVYIEYHNITVYAPAVAQTDQGHKGVISTITVTIQSKGSGRVFVDTLPLTQMDMQGSARLAVKVASSLVKRDGINADQYDYFFVIRTSSPIIGGPSAGAVMTLATIALLENWTIADDIVMTGMINPDGSIGPIGGIPQKIDAAASVGATRFLIPSGQMTYTEMVTETTQSNGWWQTITRPVTRNVSKYAMDKYGIKVYEVEDINDVLFYATGHRFPITSVENRITTEDYNDSMKPLAENLLNDAQDLFSNASELFNHSKIPNKWPYYYRNRVTDYLNYAESYLTDAKTWYQNKLYYSSASSSFQSLINSRFVIYACNYFNTTDKEEYVNSLFNETKTFFNLKSKYVKENKIEDMVSLQCIGIAQKKSQEAAEYLQEANTSINKGDFFTAMFKIAFTLERSKSIEWWVNLTSKFNKTGEIDNNTLNALAEEYLDNAQQIVAYASVLLQEMGKSSSYLSSAEDLITSARNAKEDGYPAAALFESLEALVKGNLALELVDGVTKDKIERTRESASHSIDEARQQGIEPVLSVSYYELAETLVNESSYEDAMFQYKYSDLVAGVISFGEVSSSHSSRYLGIPAVNLSANTGFLVVSNDFSIWSLLVGIAIGLFLGIILLAVVYLRLKNKNTR